MSFKPKLEKKTKVEIIVDERTEELTKIISEKFSNDIEAAYQKNKS